MIHDRPGSVKTPKRDGEKRGDGLLSRIRVNRNAQRRLSDGASQAYPKNKAYGLSTVGGGEFSHGRQQRSYRRGKGSRLKSTARHSIHAMIRVQCLRRGQWRMKCERWPDLAWNLGDFELQVCSEGAKALQAIKCVL